MSKKRRLSPQDVPNSAAAASGEPFAFLAAGATAVCVFLLAMAFAIYTRDAWEDFYITFRASRNLAMGHGLLFTPGQRVHSFTSPLHTLLLAFLSFVTGNTSEMPVLWISRVILAGVLACAAALLLGIGRRLKWGALAVVFLAAFMALDAKTVDFTINGMETALMIFFLALALYAHVERDEGREWKLLAVAWAGLQWTRPEGFAYAGLLALGFLLFPAARGSDVSRKDVFVAYCKAGASSIALYLPWILFAWIYYGSPVPHPIAARSMAVSFPQTFHALLPQRFSGRLFLHTLDCIFAPAFSAGFPGWHPSINTVYSRGLALVAISYWVFPFGHFVGRAASLAFLGAVCFMAFVITIPMPWYLPVITLLGAVVFACSIADALRFGERRLHEGGTVRRLLNGGLTSVAGGLLLIQFVLTACVAEQLRINQAILEEGNRKQVGLWLRENAATPHDSVFLEPLGYIGYFSNLGMYDFPGLASPEVVAARRKLGDNWAGIIRELKPDWVVLRPQEVKEVMDEDPALLKTAYARAKVFDALPALLPYIGRPGVRGLIFGATLVVFRRMQ